MMARKRGGQPGNQNAVTHGGHRASFRAARRTAVLALYEESRRKSGEWASLCPPTDYGAIVDRLRDLKRQNAAGDAASAMRVGNETTHREKGKQTPASISDEAGANYRKVPAANANTGRDSFLLRSQNN